MRGKDSQENLGTINIQNEIGGSKNKRFSVEVDMQSPLKNVLNQIGKMIQPQEEGRHLMVICKGGILENNMSMQQ